MYTAKRYFANQKKYAECVNAHLEKIKSALCPMYDI